MFAIPVDQLVLAHPVQVGRKFGIGGIGPVFAGPYQFEPNLLRQLRPHSLIAALAGEVTAQAISSAAVDNFKIFPCL